MIGALHPRGRKILIAHLCFGGFSGSPSLIKSRRLSSNSVSSSSPAVTVTTGRGFLLCCHLKPRLSRGFFLPGKSVNRA